MLQDSDEYEIKIFSWSTSANSVFAVRYAHLNAFGTSQTRKTLYEMAAEMTAMKNGENNP
jgi:hypothetical protein